MLWRSSTTVAGASLAAAAVRAAQPGAVAPIAAPMRDLTWGQVNFLHTTDTHGWLGGHLQEPQYSADWGDYISFTEHMRKKADDDGVDLIVVDTGDRVEGNGLYDASTPKGLFQYDIYAENDADIICTGNHELYIAATADREHNITVPNYREKYIASNLDYIDPKAGDRAPMAQRYRKFKTKQGLEVVAFGFIFDFTGNANNTVVKPVAETIKEDWFQEAMREKADLFVVIGHVGLRMEEFKTIFTTLRKQNWFTPIAFFGGHAHVRDAVKFDAQAMAIASGRYFETIGWMSIDGIKKKKSSDVSTEASVTFSRSYIDTNLYGMHYHTGLNETEFPTKHGKRVSDTIARARNALQLDHKFGCAPKNLWMARTKYPSEDSIFSWIENEVLPDVIVNKQRKDEARLAIMNTGGIRFDIFRGAFTRDSTYIVCPFTSGFRYVPDVPYGIAKKVTGILNEANKILSEGVDTRFLAMPEQMFPTELIVQGEEEAEEPRLELRDIKEPRGDKSEPQLIGGYTTKDDFGTNGDDSIHEPLKFYNQPNVFQSQIGFPKEGEPETVDLVFVDFIQPWIIPALKFSGGDYSDADAQQYMDGTFTYHMSEWISKNWKGDC